VSGPYSHGGSQRVAAPTDRCGFCAFTWSDDRPLHPDLITDWFQRHAKRDVRHSYATAALAAGIPAKIISELLGHANVQITLDTYSHVIPGLNEQAAATVARLILKGSDTDPKGVPRQCPVSADG
jgi:hypothetical protein